MTDSNKEAVLPSAVEAIGRTPLVELSHLTRDLHGRGLAKIENRLHDRRDVTYQEDATQMRQTSHARVAAALYNFVVALANQLGFSSLPSAWQFLKVQPVALIFSSAQALR